MAGWTGSQAELGTEAAVGDGREAAAGNGDEAPGADEGGMGPEQGAEYVLAPPYTLNTINIVRLVYQESPSLAASREEKEAAKHQLTEFKANLSRLEPFVETRGETSRFPVRRDSEGLTGEVVGGVQKETFEGAILRLESGASVSRVEFGEVNTDQEAVESGSGALVRARVEVPFVGSRRRQERVISQAFQESTARRAELDYLSNYRTFVETALSYYWTALLYRNYVRAYEERLHGLQSLRNDRRVKKADHATLDSAIGSAKVLRDQYESYYENSLTALVAALGIDLDAEYALEEPAYRPSPYIERAGTEAGQRQMIEDAYLNNPRFRVLNDAIKDAELQRSLAIAGKLDITAFVEGTQFPFGAETYDDRVEGWQINAGVTVRLNDRRVLNASRLKAEAQIRQFRAEIDAERRKIEQEIVTQTNRLRDNDETRHEILDVIRKTRTEFVERSRNYLSGNKKGHTIDDVLLPLKDVTRAQVRLASNTYRSGNAEAALMAATGEVYRLVGMKIESGTVPEESR